MISCSSYVPILDIFIEIIDLEVSSLYLDDANSYCEIAKSILFCLNKISPDSSWIYPFVEFDENYNLKRSLVSSKVDIKNNQWTLYNPKVLENDMSVSLKEVNLYSNFNYQRIQNQVVTIG